MVYVISGYKQKFISLYPNILGLIKKTRDCLYKLNKIKQTMYSHNNIQLHVIWTIYIIFHSWEIIQIKYHLIFDLYGTVDNPMIYLETHKTALFNKEGIQSLLALHL